MNFSVENGTVIFPEGITKIPMGAFSSCKELTTVIIPGSVTNIGDGAFRNCTNLVSAVIPGSVTGLGLSIFENCTRLTDITLSEGIRCIGRNAFRRCSGLKHIVLPESLTEISDDPFSECGSLERFDVGSGNRYFSSHDGNLYSKDGTELVRFAPGKKGSSYSVPKGILRIGANAFAYCRDLKEVVSGTGFPSFRSS